MSLMIANFSCSTIEIDQEESTEENKNIINQIAQLTKQNKSNEEEISFKWFSICTTLSLKFSNFDVADPKNT